MRVRFASLMGLCFAVLMGLVLASGVEAQDKAPKAQKAQKAEPKLSNIQGTVQMVANDVSTITVRVGSVPRKVIYSANTKFLYGHSDNNKPGALGQVKQGNYISCAGTFDAKAQLMARECVYREEK